MEKKSLDSCKRTTNNKFQTKMLKYIDYVPPRCIPNKDNEFKNMMIKDEVEKQQDKNLEVDDWSMYDGQYPRLGPKVLKNS